MFENIQKGEKSVTGSQTCSCLILFRLAVALFSFLYDCMVRYLLCNSAVVSLNTDQSIIYCQLLANIFSACVEWCLT